MWIKFKNKLVNLDNVTSIVEHEASLTFWFDKGEYVCVDCKNPQHVYQVISGYIHDGECNLIYLTHLE